MPPITEKLIASLEAVQRLQADARRVFRNSELRRTHLMRLMRQGYLRPAKKGWIISSSPGSDDWETTP